MSDALKALPDAAVIQWTADGLPTFMIGEMAKLPAMGDAMSSAQPIVAGRAPADLQGVSPDDGSTGRHQDVDRRARLAGHSLHADPRRAARRVRVRCACRLGTIASRTIGHGAMIQDTGTTPMMTGTGGAGGVSTGWPIEKIG